MLLDIITRLVKVEYMVFNENELINAEKIIGLRQVVRSINDDQLGCVLIAYDADEQIKQNIITKCKAKNVPYAESRHSKKELGAIAEIDVSCAALGIKKQQ